MNLRNRSRALLAIGLAGLVFALPALAGPWQPYGLTDRPVAILGAHPATGDDVFALIGDLGAYSPDAGASWRHRTHDAVLLPPTEFPGAFIAGSPSQAYLNRYNVPWWSPDGTRTWAPISFPEPTRADDGNGFAIGGVNPADPREIVAFFGGRVSRTTDGGSTWSFEVGPFHATRITVDWIARRIYAWRFDGFASRPLDGAGPWITQTPVTHFDALNLVSSLPRAGRCDVDWRWPRSREIQTKVFACVPY